MVVIITIQLLGILVGPSRAVSIPPQVCKTCNGTRYISEVVTETCTKCLGSGWMFDNSNDLNLTARVPCNGGCGGSGKINIIRTVRCPDC